MLRSLYSGVSGMRSFQTKMDVISNNIANSNTTGFKSGSVRFQDMMSQTIANAQAPTANGLGGINPQQIGLGVTVGSIDTNMVGGSLQLTNRDMDFALEGQGLFVVSSDEGTTLNYTRDGAFYKDTSGDLVNSNGQMIMGYRGGPINLDIEKDGTFYGTGEDQTINLSALTVSDNVTIDVVNPFEDPDEDGSITQADGKLQSFTIDTAGNIVGVYQYEVEAVGEDGNTLVSSGSARVLIGQVSLASFSNPAGLEKAGGNNYIVSNNSGDPDFNLAGSPGKGTINQGYLEMSNVDLAYEFTEMIVTSRAYQANSRSITTSDEMLQELINLKR